MSSKRLRLILIIGIALIVALIGAGLLLTYAAGHTKEVSLTWANVSPGNGMDAAANGVNNTSKYVSVTTDNVQAVIATLKRPDSYTRYIRIESYYSGGTAVYVIKSTVEENNAALNKNGPDGKSNIIVAGGKRYFWYDGDKNYTVHSVDLSEDEKKYTDEYQMILTYEDVLKVDKSSITNAGFKEYNGENCIAVTYVSGQLKYATTCYVSVNNGLLAGAEQYDGGTLIYRMATSDYSACVADPSAFNLPDGKNALSSP